jgi:hypothetical protein
VLPQATAAAGVKRSRSSSPHVEPQPLPTRDLPTAVWEDHLLPLLTRKEATRLGCTCKALRGLVREHFKDVGEVKMVPLQAMLTTFPRARTVTLKDSSGWVGAQEGDGVQWLREGGHGRCLERVTMRRYPYADRNDLLHQTLRDGALPSLRNLYMDLEYESHRALLTDGLVAGMHELRLVIKCSGNDATMGPQLAALGLVRHLPALAKLDVIAVGDTGDPVQWPPIIPPRLRALRIEVYARDGGGVSESLLGALPGMLGASGARLERLEVVLPKDFEAIGDALVHLAQALRCCSPTLKGFYLATGDREAFDTYIRGELEPDDVLVERLRVHYEDLLAGVSACRELRVLVLSCMDVEPSFPPGAALPRLTHLEMSDSTREHPHEGGVTGVWELMASGGLPALAKLSVTFYSRWGSAEEVRTRLAPAFEAVAGTLTHLHLEKYDTDEWLVDEVAVGYELGVAVGKLRRLEDLAFGMSEEGRAYPAVAQGLSASTGDCPLPGSCGSRCHRESSDADLLTSVLTPLPSVRVFSSDHHYDDQSLLVTACALRQAGYKHNWAPTYPGPDARAVLRAISPCKILHGAYGYSGAPPWLILPYRGFPKMTDCIV